MPVEAAVVRGDGTRMSTSFKEVGRPFQSRGPLPSLEDWLSLSLIPFPAPHVRISRHSEMLNETAPDLVLRSEFGS